MLALLIQVVREMVFTLGKWSFSKKAGKFISCSIRAATKGLGSKSKGWIHSILVTEGQQEVHLLRLLRGALQDLIKNYKSPVCADPEKRGSLPGQEVEHWAETVDTLWHLLEKTRVAWQPLQIWNNVNDSAERSPVQLHWVIWNLWLMN